MEKSIKIGEERHNFVQFVFNELLVEDIYCYKRDKLLQVLTLWIKSGQMVVLHTVFGQILTKMDLKTFETSEDLELDLKRQKAVHLIALDIMNHLSSNLEFKEYLISVNFLENGF